MKKVSRITNFIERDIWTYPTQGLPWLTVKLLLGLKVLIIAVKGFNKNDCTTKSSALTFLSTLSWVPSLVIVIGISHGLGFDVKKEIYRFMQGQDKITDHLLGFAENMLDKTRGDVITFTGLLVLFFTVGRLLHNIESIFNSIWNINSHRTVQRKFTDYTAILILAPILMFSSSSLNIFIHTEVESLLSQSAELSFLSTLLEKAFSFIPYTLLWILLSLLYIIMPNTKVQIKSALIAGTISGTLFQLTQWFYINFQVGVSNYNAIYGSLAALPLFLIWLYTSWTITLFGAELAYAHQHLEEYDSLESTSYSAQDKKYIAFVVMRALCNAFQQGRSMTRRDLSKETGFTTHIIVPTLDTLIACKLVGELNTQETAYQPCLALKNITPALVLQRMEAIHGGEIRPRNVLLANLVQIPAIGDLNTPFIALPKSFAATLKASDTNEPAAG